MLREEAAKLLMMMQGAYPNYKPLDKTVTVNTYEGSLPCTRGGYSGRKSVLGGSW